MVLKGCERWWLGVVKRSRKVVEVEGFIVARLSGEGLE
jgi:hypothetical protein